MAAPELCALLKGCIESLQSQRQTLPLLKQKSGLSSLFLDGVDFNVQQYIDSLSKSDQALTKQQKQHDSRAYALAVIAATDASILIREQIQIIGSILEHVNENENQAFSRDEIYEICEKIEESTKTIDKHTRTLGSLAEKFDKASLQQDIAQVNQEGQRQIETKIREIPLKIRRGSFSVARKSFDLKFETLDWFWQSLMPHRPDGRVEGVVITEAQVGCARRYLKRFVDAWLQVHSDPMSAPTDMTRLQRIEQMPKIALVLNVARKQQFFSKFVEYEVYDYDMDDDPFNYKVDEALPGEGNFIGAQYSRVKERPWPDGGRLELKAREPLPLIHIRNYYKRGEISSVDKVADAWRPHEEFACKVIRTGADRQLLQQLENEIKCLQEVGNEPHGHHIVQYVKSYRRGDEIGMLLRPVAENNLDSMLKDSCTSVDDRRKNRPDLIRAFGCLAYSMCYLHNIKLLRHRDVKPHNILIVRNHLTDKPVFIWSDFGLAYCFREKGASQTADAFFRATKEYEAPEINEQKESSHGRSADVFSLGCVYLEIISVLCLPANLTPEKIPLRRFWPYKDNMDKLGEWITAVKSKLKTSLSKDDKYSRKLLEVAEQMILQNERKRSKIGKVVESLASASSLGTSDSSPPAFCQNCLEKKAVDLSSHPLHPGIFKHRKVDWPNLRRLSKWSSSNT